MTLHKIFYGLDPEVGQPWPQNSKYPQRARWARSPRYERSVIDRITDFNDPRQEWRRLFSELLGTFFLVLAAKGRQLREGRGGARV